VPNEPVLITIILAVLTGVGAAANLLATDHTTAGIAAAVGTAITAALGFYARSKVTPLADPKDDNGEALLPASTVLGGASGAPLTDEPSGHV
jgi:hypothetical protein